LLTILNLLLDLANQWTSLQWWWCHIQAQECLHRHLRCRRRSTLTPSSAIEAEVKCRRHNETLMQRVFKISNFNYFWAKKANFFNIFSSFNRCVDIIAKKIILKKRNLEHLLNWFFNSFFSWHLSINEKKIIFEKKNLIVFYHSFVPIFATILKFKGFKKFTNKQKTKISNSRYILSFTAHYQNNLLSSKQIN
jgi:hypothetical protein